jgi:ABC-2 type transport system permease protein
MDPLPPSSAGAPIGAAVAPAPGMRAVVRREVRRIATRRTNAFLALVLPLVGWVLLRSVFGAHVVRDLPIIVIDGDQSVLSRRVVRAIDATPVVRVAGQRADATDAEGVLLRGDAYAVVVIPKGLQRAVARHERAPVQLFTNGQLMLPASLIARDVRAAVGTISAELDVRSRVGRGESPMRARISAEPIRSELHPLYNPALDYAAFLFLALVPTLLHVFVIALGVQAIGTELKGGSAAEWVECAGGNIVVATAGKFLPYTLWFMALGILMTEGALHTLHLPMAGSRSVLYAGLLLLVLAYQGIALVLVAFTANFRLSSSLAAFIAGPAFAVAGVSFPRSAMPPAGRVWSAALPLTHYLELQTEQVLAGAPLRVSLPLLGILAVVAVVLPALSLRRLGFVARTPAFWGRI